MCTKFPICFKTISSIFHYICMISHIPIFRSSFLRPTAAAMAAKAARGLSAQLADAVGGGDRHLKGEICLSTTNNQEWGRIKHLWGGWKHSSNQTWQWKITLYRFLDGWSIQERSFQQKKARGLPGKGMWLWQHKFQVHQQTFDKNERALQIANANTNSSSSEMGTPIKI